MKNKKLALGVCQSSEHWPQVCRVKITFELLLTNFSVFTTTNSMKYLVNWIPLNTHVRFVHYDHVTFGTEPLEKAINQAM